MPVFDRDILSPGLPNESIVTVWDIDQAHWKAIRLDRILKVEQDAMITPLFSEFGVKTETSVITS